MEHHRFRIRIRGTSLRTLSHRTCRGKGDIVGEPPFPHTKDIVMNISLSLAPLVSLLAGVLILIVPRLLNYIVATYLIVFGLLGLFGDIHLR
jgi:Protein of unknown function (DUF3096)